jgi:hypothetical protein
VLQARLKAERDAKYAQIEADKQKEKEAQAKAEAEAQQKKAELEAKNDAGQLSLQEKSALLESSLGPKEGDSANVDEFVKTQLSPAPSTYVCVCVTLSL